TGAFPKGTNPSDRRKITARRTATALVASLAAAPNPLFFHLALQTPSHSPPPLCEKTSPTANMSTQSVQCFGKKKTATAVAHCKAGKGLIKVNGRPLQLVQPEVLRFKVYEPILVVGLDKFANIDIRVRVTGGGHTSQVYAIRQAIAKSLVAYYQKFVDEHSKNLLKQALVAFDRTLLVADNRRCEPKKFGGKGARARFQKSYR
ncbi:hypothetical protein LLEC1_07184, partial [Akanthomyces lecanii]